jgi:hypothetical protein
LVTMVMTPEPVPEHPRCRLVLCSESDAEAANQNAEALISLDYMFERSPDGDFTRASILEAKPDLVPCKVRLSRMLQSELLWEQAVARLDVTNRTQAVTKAIAEGLIAP